MLIVSNKKSTMTLFNVLSLIVCGLIILLFIYDTFIFVIIFIIIISFLLYIIITLRVTEYNNIGGRVSIKQFHPFKVSAKHFPIFEIPENNLHRCQLKKVRRSLWLSFAYQSESNWRKKSRIKLRRFTKQQIQQISDSLKEILSRNNSER